MKKLMKWLGILSFFIVVLASVATLVVQAIGDAEERHTIEDTLERQQIEEIEKSPITIDKVEFSIEDGGVVYWSDKQGHSGQANFEYHPLKKEVEFLGSKSPEEYPYLIHNNEFVEAISAYY